MPSLFGHCSSSLAPESVTVSEEAFKLKAFYSSRNYGQASNSSSESVLTSSATF